MSELVELDGDPSDVWDTSGAELEIIPEKPEEIYEITRTGIVWYRDPTLEEWLEIGKGLNMLDWAQSWLWADFLNMGSNLWGEMYTQALEESGYKFSHLSNAKSVGRKIPPHIRRHDIPFSVHQALAPMSKGDDDTEGHEKVRQWLDFVGQKDLTRRMTKRLTSSHERPRTVSNEEIDLLRGSKNTPVGKRRDRQARKFLKMYCELKAEQPRGYLNKNDDLPF